VFTYFDALRLCLLVGGALFSITFPTITRAGQVEECRVASIRLNVVGRG
jgi:hypothetical protein